MSYRTQKDERRANRRWAEMEGQGRRAGIVPLVALAVKDVSDAEEEVHLMFPIEVPPERVEDILLKALAALGKKGA